MPSTTDPGRRWAAAAALLLVAPPSGAQEGQAGTEAPEGQAGGTGALAGGTGALAGESEAGAGAGGEIGAGGEEGCECSDWEDHPNTYWNGGEQATKDGVSFADCRAGCCENEECIAFGHCMEGATSCIWPIESQHCTWYKTRGASLRRNDGHFTGIFHAPQHCKPAPGEPGAAGGDVPDFHEGETGWELVVLLAFITLAYLGAGVVSKKTGASDGWLLHGRFWNSLSGMSTPL